MNFFKDSVLISLFTYFHHKLMECNYEVPCYFHTLKKEIVLGSEFETIVVKYILNFLTVLKGRYIWELDPQEVGDIALIDLQLE